jgi:hypothetical protein
MTFIEFLIKCRDIIYDNTQAILKKFSSISLWIWIIIFAARCHYGTGFDEILIVTTLAVLGTRYFSGYYQSKNGNSNNGIIPDLVENSNGDKSNNMPKDDSNKAD